MKPLKIAALVAVLVPAMCVMLSSMVFAVADANCNITTPAPTLHPGTVLVPVSNSGEPCYTRVDEGTIYNLDSDAADAKEERIMDGEITGLSNPECRWTCSANCSCESSVTVTGPGYEANPPVWPSSYRAYAVQQAQADVYDTNEIGSPIVSTLSVSPVCQIDYPNTGTVSKSAANYELDFDYTFDHKPLVRMRIFAWSEVFLDSQRTEVTLTGSANQGVSEWSGELTAWQIGGDDVIPIIIVRQTIGQEQAIWQVR